MNEPTALGTQQIYEGVTLVTRNDERRDWTILLELAVYWAALYYITHPDIGEKIKERLRPHWRRILHRLSIWRAREAIQALPETDHE